MVDLWGKKLNASKTKIMMVSKSCTMHPQSPASTIGRTVLKESDDLVILGVIFDSKMTFEKHLHSVSRAAYQWLGFLRKSWQVLHDRLLLVIAHRRSVAVLCILYKIRCNPMHPLYGALPEPYMPLRVARGAVIAHCYSYAPPSCRTSQDRSTFIP